MTGPESSAASSRQKCSSTKRKSAVDSASGWLGYAVAITSFCMYQPDQMVGISSKHLSVALNLSNDATRIYMTKFYAAKTLSNFLGSILMICLNKFVFVQVTPLIVIVPCTIMCLIRLMGMLLFCFSSSAAVDFYYAMIMGSFLQGVVGTAFYPLAADHMTLISIMFKVSKASVWGVQFIMDLSMSNKPFSMMVVLMTLNVLSTGASVAAWIIYVTKPQDTMSETEKCLAKVPVPREKLYNDDNTTYVVPATDCMNKDANAEEPGNTILDKLRDAYEVKVDSSPKRRFWGCCGARLARKRASAEARVPTADVSLWNHFLLCLSPTLICLLAWPMRAFFIPGIIPYTFVDRDLAHPINFWIFPFAFAATIIAHYIKKGVKSLKHLSYPWVTAFWHIVIWSLIAVPGLSTIVIYCAIHNRKGALYALFKNKVLNTTLMAAQYVFFLNLGETFAFEGVSANVKYKRGDTYHRGDNGLLYISINSLMSQLAVSITYKLSCGYIMAMSEIQTCVEEWSVTYKMSAWSAFWHWISRTLTLSYNDVLNEFKGNIAKVVEMKSAGNTI